jgi:signal transduction histidine kinase
MRTLRMCAAAAVVGGLYALGAVLTYRYLSAPGAGASFFPPAGISLAALLATPRRYWWMFLLAVGIAEMTVDLTHGQTMFMALGFGLANVVEPLVGASAVRLAAPYPRTRQRAFLARYVLCGVMLGPLVGALIGATVATIANSGLHYWTTALEWWLGDAVGVLVVATPVLAFIRRDFYPMRVRLVECAAIAAVAVCVVVIPAVHLQESSAYAVLPVLLFAAIRGGPFEVGVVGLGVGFSASWVAASGNATSLLAVHGTEGALIDTQLFIGVTILTALILAVEIAERVRTEQELARTEMNLVRAELTAMQAAENERRRIARETHDIVGHALNVMILSAAAVRRIFYRDPKQARHLLSTLEDVGRDAFRDLDVALGLTDQSPEFAAPKGLADLDELIQRLVQAGMEVDFAIDGSERPVPRLVDGSAYRIVQESLTNVARHSIDARTSVIVRYRSDTLILEILDDGGRSASSRERGGNGRRNGNVGNGHGDGNGHSNGNGNGKGNNNDGGGGRGLIGMRERVAVLGGKIQTGPVRNGYSVVAELPLEPV